VRIRELTRHMMPMLDTVNKHELSLCWICSFWKLRQIHRELVNVDAAELEDACGRFRTEMKDAEHAREMESRCPPVC